jgi:hypothetical protein
MKCFITHILPQHPNSVKIQWDLSEVSESGSFVFTVERSGSPGGPWTTVTVTPLTDIYLYTDLLSTEYAQTLSLARDIYYRVKADPPSHTLVYSPAVNLDNLAANELSGPQAVIGLKVTNPGQQDQTPTTQQFERQFPDATVRKRLLKNAITRHHYIGLRHIYGLDFWLLKRRHFGTRCTLCYDAITNEVLNSQCSICFATSWVGGYYTPVAMLGKKIEAPIQSQVTSQSKDDTHFTQIQLLDFPRVEEGDLLVEKFTNKRFLIRSVILGSVKTVQVFQIAQVSELPHSAYEYTISVTL